MHKCSNEFEFLPDPNIVYGVTCPLMSEKLTYNLVATLAPSYLIRSSLFLQVIRTTINAGMSSNFNQIGLLTVELAALECLEKSL